MIGGNHVDWKLDELLRQLERAAELCVCVVPLDRNIGPCDIAEVTQSRPERFGKWMRRRQRHEDTDARYFSELLRARLNVRFGPLCGLKSDIFRSPRSARSGSRRTCHFMVSICREEKRRCGV